MKKLLMGAICLSLFAIALSLVQISCSKTEAQNSTNQIISLNKILYKETFPGGVNRFSIMNYDGTGIQHLNISFPAGFTTTTYNQPVLSPDATKVFFAGYEAANNSPVIYSCDTSGANLMRIAYGDPTAFDAFVTGAY